MILQLRISSLASSSVALCPNPMPSPRFPPSSSPLYLRYEIANEKNEGIENDAKIMTLFSCTVVFYSIFDIRHAPPLSYLKGKKLQK